MASKSLQTIYERRKVLPRAFIEDQRIFYVTHPLSGDTFSTLRNNAPIILEMIGKHYQATLDEIADLSTKLC